MIKEEWVKIGTVGVDSGQLIIVDPCYLSSWKHNEYGSTTEDDKSFSYAGACNVTIKEPCYGEIGIEGVAFASGFGDGCYPVYARIKDFGEWGKRIIEVKILMEVSEEEDEEIH